MSVIIAEFFSFPNVPQGDNPDTARNNGSFTVRIAGMVDIPGEVLGGIAVDVIVGTDEKNVDIPPRQALSRFLPRNLLAGILKNPGALLDGLGGEDAFPVNVRSADSDLDLHAIVPSHAR
jgi:hypothetical protein